MPQLVVKLENQIIKRVTLTRENYMIGRRTDCDLVLNDRTVSNHHARIMHKAAEYLLEDMGSTNSTFVNKRAIKEHWLQDGDILQIGRHIIAYSAESRLHEQLARMKTSPLLMDAKCKAWLEIMNGRHAGFRIELKLPPDALSLYGEDGRQLMIRILPNAYLLHTILTNNDEQTQQLQPGDVFTIDHISFKLYENHSVLG